MHVPQSLMYIYELHHDVRQNTGKHCHKVFHTYFKLSLFDRGIIYIPPKPKVMILQFDVMSFYHSCGIA